MHYSDTIDPERTEPWVLKLICCGHADGYEYCDNRGQAVRFREAYIDSMHDRQAILGTAPPHGVCANCGTPLVEVDYHEGEFVTQHIVCPNNDCGSFTGDAEALITREFRRSWSHRQRPAFASPSSNELPKQGKSKQPMNKTKNYPSEALDAAVAALMSEVWMQPHWATDRLTVEAARTIAETVLDAAPNHLRLLLDDAERQLGALRQERDSLLNRLGGFDA
jgi:hypothetical protein